MGSHLLKKVINLLRTFVGGRRKWIPFFLVTVNYIRTLYLQQLTDPTIKIGNKVNKSWSYPLKFM